MPYRDLVQADQRVLVPLQDVTAVIRALRQLSADRPRIAQAAAAYQRYILDNYSMQRYTDRTDATLAAVGPDNHHRLS